MLWLTVIEQRVFMAAVGISAMQVAVVSQVLHFTDWQCRAMHYAVYYVNLYASVCGTSLSLCRSLRSRTL